MAALYACGKGIGEPLQFLSREQPSLEVFLNWMEEGAAAAGAGSPLADVLTPQDLQDFSERGVVVLRAAVEPDDCAAAREAIHAFLNLKPEDAVTWYAAQELSEGLMVPLYQDPALQKNRHALRVRKAFEQLYGTVAIHPVVDKVSFNPPETEQYRFKGSSLHWDVSLALPIPFKLQGLLYLSDCPADGGAFHCVPRFHKEIDTWLPSLPPSVDPRTEALRSLKPVPVPGAAGDLVIWHQALPHCATPNRSNRPRYVQYITYDPDGYREQDVWI